MKMSYAALSLKVIHEFLAVTIKAFFPFAS